MKHCFMLIFGIILCTNLCAQNYSNEVTLVHADDNSATLLVTAVSDKKKDAELLAAKSAFYTLFHSGVPGVKNGAPMIAVEKSDFDYRFFSESRYINYISSEVETVNSEKFGGKYRVTVKLTIQLKSLCADLEHNKMVVSPGWTDSKAVKATAALNPTIVIMPDLSDNTDLKTKLEEVVESPTYKYAIRKITSEFSQRGYTTQDAFAIVQGQINSAMMNAGTQTDIATELMKGIPGDILVYVDLDIKTEGRKCECNLALHAFEMQTRNNIADAQFPSGQYMTTEYIKLVDYAIKKIKNNFFESLQEKFENTIRQGRTILIDMSLAQSVTDWDFDQDSPASGNYFKDELLTWLEAHSHQSVPNLTIDATKRLQVRMNIPLWDASRNRSYPISRFNSDLRKFFREQFGENYKANVQAVGQGINVIIE